MMTSINYSDKELENFLKVDGSLRDIYVDNTTINDWDILIDTLKTSGYVLTYFMGENICELPDSLEKLFIDTEQFYLLRVQEENVIFNTYFDIIDRIEFDLDPRDFVAFEQNIIAYKFMRLIADTLNKKVKLTPENTSETSLFEIKPNDSRIYKGRN